MYGLLRNHVPLAIHAMVDRGVYQSLESAMRHFVDYAFGSYIEENGKFYIEDFIESAEDVLTKNTLRAIHDGPSSENVVLLRALTESSPSHRRGDTHGDLMEENLRVSMETLQAVIFATRPAYDLSSMYPETFNYHLMMSDPNATEFVIRYDTHAMLDYEEPEDAE